MKSVRKTAPEPEKHLIKLAGEKPKRVLMDAPMSKYIIYHDPKQWDDDIRTGDSPE